MKAVCSSEYASLLGATRAGTYRARPRLVRRGQHCAGRLGALNQQEISEFYQLHPTTIADPLCKTNIIDSELALSVLFLILKLTLLFRKYLAIRLSYLFELSLIFEQQV